MRATRRIQGFAQIEFAEIPTRLSSLTLLLILILLNNTIVAQDLDPTLPPSGNFDLSYWKLTRPNQQELDEDALTSGTTIPGEFYTDPATGAMVFVTPNDGKTGGSSYPRTELREMLRRGDTRIGTQGINKNNWVFSSSTLANQEAAGGVDGILTATVAVDHVSETSDETFKIGRVIVGQIHASDDEPCRLYYRKLPENTRGSIYFAHEPTTGPEQWYELIGSRSNGIDDPADGVALGEKFSYEIKAIGNTLTVTIMREGKPDVSQEVDMTDSGFANDWMYFKAGNYNQNNAGDPDEYAQVSFFALDVTHFEPTPPSEYLAPSDIPRFKPILAESKLQGPTSSTLASVDRLNSGYTHPEYFHVVDGDKILFSQSGDSRRTELRHLTNWDLTQANRSLHGRLDIVEQTCDQVTVMQIHDDANAGDGPNKPLLRIYKHNGRTPTNHIWAAIKTDDGGSATTHVDLGEDPGGVFNCDIRLVDGNMIIDFQGEEKVNMDVSFWTYPSYWKAGVYLQDDGVATAHFDHLFEGDGSPQNFAPSISITSPESNTNFLPGSDITIMVDAEDSDGELAKVEFFEGGSNKIGEVLSAPYTFVWTDVAEGSYTLTARAIDDEGAAKTSLSVNITVGEVVSVTGVELTDIGTIAVGAEVQLEASVFPASATNQNLTFVSDDATVATVSPDGLVRGISEGSTTVTVTTEEGGFTDAVVVNVVAPSDKFNWARFQPVVGTGTPDGSNVVTNLVDDDTDTRWSVEGMPQSATIDLGGDITITRTEVTSYEGRAYQFIIEGAATMDGPYTTIVDRSNNTSPGTPATPIVDLVDSVEARFVRITVSGADVYTGAWVSLTELRVFGEGEREPVSTSNDLADSDILLYPNPTGSIVTISATEQFHSASIYDQSGRLVLRKNLSSSATLDLSRLSAGIYLIKLSGNNKQHISKLIKR
ncbi:uncharacterized protein YjdB [Lewinella marina]|uniref:BIG2 domain-containing protein n=1 Tax=Neolewinella marina TaxID=438751 RepID=A0A2G0CBL4_9BACT|nr:polysaccharide lyase family 7 protein [Neolewinella marina]NJB87107.1 uncharacterized protein YjdB [Neolewinella marina]PHK97364.1 hypothetical protein CGL56_16290 [Neolewinella marina]